MGANQILPMAYEVKFSERGHAWFTYRILKAFQRRGSPENSELVKIQRSTLLVPDNDLVDRLQQVAGKIGAKYDISKAVEV